MMQNGPYRCLLISDFNIENFAALLRNDAGAPAIEAIVAEYGQVMSVLMNSEHECWRINPYCTIVWTQPQSVIQSFNRALCHDHVSFEEVLNEVDYFAATLMKLRDRSSFVFIPTWVSPPYNRIFRLLQMDGKFGVSNLLMRMNLRLSEHFDEIPNFFLLNSQDWISNVGRRAFDQRLWYMGKIPFTNGVFKEALLDIKSALNGVMGNSTKLVVVDLDDTLWGGTVGDVGWKNIRLGGHDPIGEALVDFQKALKALTTRGVLLGIVSKNEESVALEAINKHPEMILRMSDFVGWKINWNDKAQNLLDLVSDLNLGLQSVVFIDDSAAERARVRETFPEVFVPEWPEDKMQYVRELHSLRCFDVGGVSVEDLKRTNMYADERRRQSLRREVGSFDEWLKTLAVEVELEELTEHNLPRANQLLNKTNQMNLTTRRMSECELKAWTNEASNKLWTIRVADKFGDSGLTGILSVAIHDKTVEIVDFVLSCRVFGRKVEAAMLYIAVTFAQSLGLDQVYAKYVVTPKNKPCLDFFKTSGFRYKDDENLFYWETKNDYPIPQQISIKNKSHLASPNGEFANGS